FKESNPQLDGAQLTEATQRTLDRLVFMRFLEDKLIETDELVERFAQSHAPWAEFVAASRRLNGVYNGIIFREHAIDAPAFRMDGAAFAGICAELSHVRSPYDFNLIPIHILGSIYERFLGKTIVVGAAGGASVVPKPEVRKAGGVYYTPEYIVRYIVGQTVGALIEGKKPEQIRPMRFADISCGSGSFLLGVYDLLLRYHAEYYNRNKRTRAEGLKAGCTETEEGMLRLSLLQKRTILLNNVYGVDVDAQAVEVAQLSLYLKLLEEETTASARTHQLSFREALLPSLNKNVVSGNSLIDFDILSGHLFEPEDERKLNPMSFAQEFPQVMRDGGFDAIVGNPPYSLIGSDRPEEQTYYRSRFSMTAYKTNTYVLFLEKGLQLLKSEGGTLGFIIPKSLVFNTFFSSVRARLLSSCAIPQIIEIREKVFASAEVGDSILFFARTDNQPTHNVLHYYKVENVFPTFEVLEKYESSQRELLANTEAFFYTNSFSIRAKTEVLSDLAVISNGLNPGNVRHILLSESPATPEHRKMLLGRDIQKYELNWSGTWVNYNPKLKSQITVSDIKSKKGMTAQAKVDFALRSPEIYTADKVMVRKTADHIVATYDEYGYHFDSLSYGIQTKPTTSESPLYLLGILNSRLMNFIHDSFSLNKEKVFAKVLAVNLGKLPIRTINFSDPADKAQHDRMVALVEGMLAAKRQLAGAGTEAERNLYERKCANLDAQIDALVYELYGLTPEEIRLVEAA
ncbi:MAG: N-6 DNA methylase, partial [Acidobacteria bacterium]|nr:N-6 DNA methylase [Acidobacteriota bacterium]